MTETPFMDRPTNEQVNALIDEILSRREFGGKGEIQEETIQQTVKPSTQPPVPRPSGGSVWDQVPVLVLVLLGALVLFAFIFGVGKYEKNQRYNGDKKQRTLKTEAPPDPMAAAIAYAERGEYGGAIVCLFALHLQQLQRQGWIVLEKSKTNLQYEFELMQRSYDDLTGFRAFKDIFNGVRFGGYGVERQAYEQWLTYSRERLERRRAG